ncbi:hypothetical protein ES703_26786 [subsurface metagenome]
MNPRMKKIKRPSHAVPWTSGSLIASLRASMPEVTIPVRAWPAISPEAIKRPMFSTVSLPLAVGFFLATVLSRKYFMTPPKKMHAVARKGRYIPTAMIIGDGDPIRIKPMPSSIPAITKGQAISPPTIPWAIMAIKLAWGAGRASLPMPLVL